MEIIFVCQFLLELNHLSMGIKLMRPCLGNRGKESLLWTFRYYMVVAPLEQDIALNSEYYDEHRIVL